MDLRIADPDDNALPVGQEGEVQMHSIVLTSGYWEKPEANRQVFTADGYLRTGDVGKLDDEGYLHITGRIKELVIRGGENIYPGEIEQAAYKHPGVQEVVVFGVDDETMGEELGLVCFVKPNTSLTEAELRKTLSQHLATYKVPKYIGFSAEPLPRNASEKLHKLRVSEMYKKGAYR
jgi:long-chain acyl-CoA synthetase